MNFLWKSHYQWLTISDCLHFYSIWHRQDWGWAQSNLGARPSLRQDIFAERYMYENDWILWYLPKNSQNSRILHGICPKKLQNSRILHKLFFFPIFWFFFWGGGTASPCPISYAWYLGEIRQNTQLSDTLDLGGIYRLFWLFSHGWDALLQPHGIDKLPVICGTVGMWLGCRFIFLSCDSGTECVQRREQREGD